MGRIRDVLALIARLATRRERGPSGRTEGESHPTDVSGAERQSGADASRHGRDFVARLTSTRLGDVAALLAIGVVIVAVRTYIVGAVFRLGDVVLVANDPYGRRYQIETAVATADGLGELVGLLSGTHRYPLFIAAFSWVAELVDGGRAVVGPLLAVYPVGAAVVTGVAVYAITVILTESRGAGLAAGVALAITPVHATRTALGYGDHHAFDYVWLALTLLAVVALAETDDRWSRQTWVAAGTLALALAVQVLAWRGGILLLVPLGIYAQYRVLVAVRRGRSPVRVTAPLTVALATGACLGVAGHVAMDWYSTSVVLMPVVLVLGVAVLGGLGEVARQTPRPTGTLVGLEAMSVVTVGALVRSQTPIATLLAEGQAYHAKVTGLGVVEGTSLLGGSSWGPITGPVSLFSLLLFVALPMLALATWRAIRVPRPEFGALSSYAWYLFGAALLQRRFAAELSVVLAPLIGLGLVALASRLGIVRPSTPVSRREWQFQFNPDVSLARVCVLATVLVLVVSASFVVIPIKMNQVTYTATEHDAARWMDSYATDRGWAYPANYVFSWWAQNRMYNYFVNGDAPQRTNLWYGYARSKYPVFLSASDPAAAYQRHREQVGFVVTTDRHTPRAAVRGGPETGSLSMYARLHSRLTSRGDGVDGLAHYRTLWTSTDGSVKVFTLVRGATLRGTTAPNATVTVSTTVTVPQRTFTYTRITTANTTGAYSVTVPYPGTYSVGNATVSVSETAVSEGANLTVARS